MRATLSSLVLFSSVLVLSDPAWAREWRVERVSGTAWTIETTEKRQALEPGMMVPEGLTIATAPSGRVRLSSENNVMTLGPGSVAVVRPKGLLSSKTEVLQRVGSIEFDVEKRRAPHFTVQTPYMAAVVKGTAFTISVSRTDTTIEVDRGLVQVQDLRSGDTAGVGAGQGASVSSADPGLRTAGIDAPDVTPGQPSAPSVAPPGQTLGGFREVQAAEASPPSGRSAGTEAAASTHDGPTAAASHSANDSGFGGYGGDDSGRDRPSLGENTADTRTASSDTPDAAPGRGPQGDGAPRSDADPGSRGDADSGPAGRADGGPGNDGSSPGGGGGKGLGNDGSGNTGNGPGAGPGNSGDNRGNGGGNDNGNNGNGNGGPSDGGQKGGGNGNGNNGNGNGNGGPDGSAGDDGGGNGGGNGRGNNGNGNGNSGSSGNDNSGNGNGNGKGSK